MRVVSGTLGSRPIKTLKGSTTRPTSDKVRAAIFNRIGPYFDSGSMLDVFGGSGAMAYESISRGFDKALVFEFDRNAARIIKENIQVFDLQDKVTLRIGDSFKLIQSLHESFDFIYIDPPYKYEHTETIVRMIIENKLIKEDGLILVETDKSYSMSSCILNFSIEAEKDYGISKLRYYQKG